MSHSEDSGQQATTERVGHTPGPWDIDVSLINGHVYLTVHTAGETPQAVAHIAGPRSEPEREHARQVSESMGVAPVGDEAFASESEVVPNARLIAAAPDLLAACRRAFEFIDGQISGVESGEDPLVTYGQLAGAIAKATAPAEGGGA